MNQSQPTPPGMQPPHSSLALGAFFLALFAFAAGLFPLVGFLGLIAVILAVLDLKSPDQPGQPRRHGFSTAAIVLGTLSTLGAIAWTIALVWFEAAFKHGSCPHLYAFDGAEYRLDADLASGALYRGAERDDVDRLESLRETGGEYRVRLQNDLEEVDAIDQLSLLVVDAPEAVDVVPMEDGTLVGARDAQAPLAVMPITSRRVDGDPREVRSYAFARPAGDRALVVLRARSSAFAEESFIRYMAQMGQGVRPLLEMRMQSDEDCACYRAYMQAEIVRLGFPMWISGGATKTRIGPVGPAVPRVQAVAIDLPAGDRVDVTLETTPRFWAIDDVMLAAWDGAALAPQTLAPIGDAELGARDGVRATLRPGERRDVRFAAPPPPAPGMRRTVSAKLRGYYDLDIGGAAGANIPRLVAHRLGWVSLPRYAERLNP